MRTQVAPGLTSNGRPEEDEGQAEGAILLLDLPAKHHKQQHVGQHMLEAGVNQDAGHPPAGGAGTHRGQQCRLAEHQNSKTQNSRLTIEEMQLWASCPVSAALKGGAEGACCTVELEGAEMKLEVKFPASGSHEGGSSQCMRHLKTQDN